MIRVEEKEEEVQDKRARVYLQRVRSITNFGRCRYFIRVSENFMKFKNSCVRCWKILMRGITS